MVRLSTIYTKTGDAGTTSLGGGTRVAKIDARIEVLGSVDETNAALGLALAAPDLDRQPALRPILARLQNELFDLGADLAVIEADAALRVTDAQVARLEADLDELNAALPALTSFVMPGGTQAQAALHLARTVARRAERDAWRLAGASAVNPAALRYLNRLSDLLFVMARAAGAGNDLLWRPGATA